MRGSQRLFFGLKTFAQGFFIGVPIYLTVTDNFCAVCKVEGVSMQPVLNPDSRTKDFVLINRWKAKQYDKIERGDIVSIVSPKDPTTLFIKRIIALEGDQIRGHCWIEGDNRKHSLDSNSFGYVPLGLVNGVATRIIWPPSRWAKLTSELPSGRNPFDHTNEEKDDVISDVRDSVKEDVICDVRDSVEDDVISDVRDTVKNDVRSDVIGDIQETITSKMDDGDIDSKTLRVNSKSELTGSSNVLTNLPQNARRHVSDITSVEAQSKVL
ncbi:mitochondrial inner membrane protease subunit 2 [Paramuricea clavata]|uniref:Mitochondrial inner membrane protease subunit 2 n=1 Tax=Paramuricea clavata TaxID=317549 RepID=A0A6S7I546_PARCT|nr:mitochondrial inner membrane protease subunit 2 [Paramuricea clavata]